MTRHPKHRSLALAVGWVFLGISLPAPAVGEWKAATAAFEAADYRTALSELQEVVASHPDYAPGYHLLGRTHFELGQIEDAIVHLARALELAPERADYRLRLAQVLIGAESFERAASTLEPLEPARLEPSLLPSYDSLLAQAATSHREPEDIVAWLGERAESRGKSALLHQTVARLHDRLGASEEAFEGYRRAYQADPRAEIAQRAMAVATRAAEGLEPGARSVWLARAADVAELVLKHKESAEMRRLAARLRFDSGDSVAAEAHFRRVLDLQPQIPGVATGEVMLDVARCAIEQGEHDRARKVLEQASESVNGDRELERRVQESLAYVLHELGDYRAAVEAYRRAGQESQADALAEALASQADYDARRKECLALEQRLQQALDEASAIRGTPDWDELERRMRERVEPCRPYL